MLDLISVFCRRDVSMQLLQARSIARHFDRNGVGRVIYVWNDTSKASNDLHTELAACLDGIPFEVILAGELGIERYAIEHDGWTTQQAAKLLAARQLLADHYLVLDAKNHFTAPCAVDDFLTEDGRGVASIEYIGDNESFRYCLEYFDVARNVVDTTGALNVTPFVFRTELVKQLLLALEHKDGSVVNAFLSHQHRLTEFMAYQVYARSQGFGAAHLFRRGEAIAETVWAATVQQDEDFDHCLRRVARGETKVLALHWMACCLLSRAQQAKIFEIWVARGLIGSIEQGENTIAMVCDRLRDGDKRFFARSIGIDPQSIASAAALRHRSVA